MGKGKGKEKCDGKMNVEGAEKVEQERVWKSFSHLFVKRSE